MPTVFGRMLPETASTGFYSKNLKFLIDLDTIPEKEYRLIRDLCILREYLKSIKDSTVALTIFTACEPKSDHISGVGLISIGLVDCSTEYVKNLVESACVNDVDYIVTGQKAPVQNEIDCGRKEIAVIDLNEAMHQAEVFARGHEIPWSFETPSWNMPWTSFYSMSDGFGQRASNEFGSKFQLLNLNDNILESTRDLFLNRVSHICYTRDRLHFIKQQRRFAKRKGWTRQLFTFEAGYYLSFYYFALWGGIDQLALLLNDALSMKVKRVQSITLGSEKFIDRVSECAPELAELYREADMKQWMSELKRIRNHSAHRGTVELTTIVQDPDTMPSEEEIEREAMETPNWQLMKDHMPKELFDWYHRSLIQKIRLSKYPVTSREASVLPGIHDTLVFFPLERIDLDTNQFSVLILRTLELLHLHLSVNPSGETEAGPS